MQDILIRLTTVFKHYEFQSERPITACTIYINTCILQILYLQYTKKKSKLHDILVGDLMF